MCLNKQYSKPETILWLGYNIIIYGYSYFHMLLEYGWLVQLRVWDSGSQHIVLLPGHKVS